jgi:hypothetical protein
MSSTKFLIYSLSYHEILLLAYVAWYNPVISWSAKAQLFNHIFQQFEPGAPYRSSTTLANEYRRLSQPVAPSPRSLEQKSSRSASPIVSSRLGYTKAELPDMQEIIPTRSTDCSSSQCPSSPSSMAGSSTHCSSSQRPLSPLSMDSSSANESVNFLLYQICATAEPADHRPAPHQIYMSPLPHIRR